MQKYIFALSNWVRELGKVEAIQDCIISVLRGNGYPVDGLETETLGPDDDRIKLSYEAPEPLKKGVIKKLNSISGVSVE